MYENFEEYYDAIMPGEAALLPYKCMFQTTGAKVYFYRFMFSNDYTTYHIPFELIIIPFDL